MNSPHALRSLLGSCNSRLEHHAVLACFLQNNKKEFIEESKARNNSFHRKGKKHAGAQKRENSTNLPKLKSLTGGAPHREKSSTNLPTDIKGSNSSTDTNPPRFKKSTRRRQPKKYAHVRSSGYGGSSVAPAPPGASSATHTTSTRLPPLNESHSQHHGHSGKRKHGRHLPPLGRGLRSEVT